MEDGGVPTRKMVKECAARGTHTKKHKHSYLLRILVSEVAGRMTIYDTLEEEKEEEEEEEEEEEIYKKIHHL